MRIIINLIDAATSFHLWGDTYDGEIGELFALQDRVTEGVMRAILPQIHGSEIDRAQRKRPQDLDAYSLTMRAFPYVFATYPDAAKQALDLFIGAMEIDPDFALATAFAAYCHAQLVLYNGTDLPNQERARALLLSDRAGILVQDDPAVLTADVPCTRRSRSSRIRRGSLSRSPGVSSPTAPHALTLREAGYRPVQYIPFSDVDASLLEPTDNVTYCPYKGDASYYSVPDRRHEVSERGLDL